MKSSFFMLFSIVLTFTFTMVIWANVPAPPSNQQIGMQDRIDDYLQEQDCRLCHGNPDQFPIEDETIPNRHHLLYGTVIPNHTYAPYGNPGELYECLSCHTVSDNEGTIAFLIERDCILCHTYANSSKLNVHHRNDLALGNFPQGPDCKACHGSLVDNMEDGHFIPETPPTYLTPQRSGGAGLPLNSEGNGAGACDYCHSTGTGSEFPGIDSATGIEVFSNKLTHHLSFRGGGGGAGSFCFWCHDFNLPLEEQIRVCENCHGRDTLHNIQADSNGDGIITPGVELPGYGHIGNPDDCWGCHGFSMSSAPGLGPTVPFISSSDPLVISASTDAVVTMNGSAFTNSLGDFEWTSNTSLTAEDGSLTILQPDAIDACSLTVTIPGTMPVGNYKIRAVKGNAVSNPVVISITPVVVISDIDCNEENTMVTIIGSGFSEKPAGTDDYINIKENDTPLNIISWTDIVIQASGAICCGMITVNTLYSSSHASVCSCEGNFDHDSDVDGTDTYNFNMDFGKSNCAPNQPCNGDFECDGDVDGSDAYKFKVDFGRSDCPACTFSCSY